MSGTLRTLVDSRPRYRAGSTPLLMAVGIYCCAGVLAPWKSHAEDLGQSALHHDFKRVGKCRTFGTFDTAVRHPSGARWQLANRTAAERTSSPQSPPFPNRRLAPVAMFLGFGIKGGFTRMASKRLLLPSPLQRRSFCNSPSHLWVGPGD